MLACTRSDSGTTRTAPRWSSSRCPDRVQDAKGRTRGREAAAPALSFVQRSTRGPQGGTTQSEARRAPRGRSGPRRDTRRAAWRTCTDGRYPRSGNAESGSRSRNDPAVRSQGRGRDQAGGHAVRDDMLLLPQGTSRCGGGRRTDAQGPDVRQEGSVQDDLRWTAVGADARVEVLVFPRADLEARRLHPEPQAHGGPVSMIRILVGGSLLFLGV